MKLSRSYFDKNERTAVTGNIMQRHRSEVAPIWEQKVPAFGQAETVEGELLRAVEKLRYEAMENGNGNWDHGFVILLRFLEEKLLDADTFTKDARLESKAILLRLGQSWNPWLADEAYDRLCDRVVEYYRYHGTQPHKTNGDLRR